MNWIDYAIIALITFSALMSLVRGFFRESLSLITWICAFFVSGFFYPYVAHYFSFFREEMVQNACAIVALFIATLIVGSIINYVIYQIVNYSGLSGLDRMLGIFFGIARGILVVAAVLFVVDSFTPFSSNKDWLQAKLIPHFRYIIQWFFDYLQQTSSFIDIPANN